MIGFSRRPSHVVTLTREGEDPLSIRLDALPIGYAEMVGRILPEGPLHGTHLFWILLARAMGSQLSATSPGPGAGASEWEAFAVSVHDELEAANLMDTDVRALLDGVAGLMRGVAELPKP